MVTIGELVALAQAGAAWERGHSIGVTDNPDAQRYALKMELIHTELTSLVKMLSYKHNEHIASLPANSILKLR